MTLRPLVALAAVISLSGCSLQGLIANVAAPQIYEAAMLTAKQAYLQQGIPAARVDCIIGKIRDQVKPADLASVAIGPDGKPDANAVQQKLQAARQAAEAACPN